MTIILALVGLARADDQNVFGIAPWNGGEFVVTEDGQSVHLNLAASVGKCNAGKLYADAGAPVHLFNGDEVDTTGSYKGEVLLEWTANRQYADLPGVDAEKCEDVTKRYTSSFVRAATASSPRPPPAAATRSVEILNSETGLESTRRLVVSGDTPQELAARNGGLPDPKWLFRLKGGFDWNREEGFASATAVEPVHSDAVDAELVLGLAYQFRRHSTLTLDAHAQLAQAVVYDEAASATRGELVFGAPAPLTGDTTVDLRYEYLGRPKTVPDAKGGEYAFFPFFTTQASWGGLIDEAGAFDVGASTWKLSAAGGVKSLDKGATAGAGLAVLGTLDASPVRLVPILQLTGNLGGTGNAEEIGTAGPAAP